MEETGQVTNDKMTRLVEASLQELEKPPEETIQQVAMTTNQEISLPEQVAHQAQMTRLPTSNQSDQSTNTTQNSASPEESQEPEEGNDIPVKIDTNGCNSTQLEQEKPQEQDSTTNKMTTSSEQQHQDQYKEQENGTFRLLSDISSAAQ